MPPTPTHCPETVEIVVWYSYLKQERFSFEFESDNIMPSDTTPLSAFLTAQGEQTFPWDVVVFAAIAAALAFQLYRILGRNIGVHGVRQGTSHQTVGRSGSRRTVPPPLPDSVTAEKGVQYPQARHEIPVPSTRVGDILVQIARVRTEFTPAGFLEGIEETFRRILSAYAQGDRKTLQDTMSVPAAQPFFEAITARETEGQTQRIEVCGLEKLAILDARILDDNEPGGVGARAHIEVEIVSRQINMLSDREGQPLEGIEAVTEFNDLWLLEASLHDALSDKRALHWRLVASRPA